MIIITELYTFITNVHELVVSNILQGQNFINLRRNKSLVFKFNVQNTLSKECNI